MRRIKTPPPGSYFWYYWQMGERENRSLKFMVTKTQLKSLLDCDGRARSPHVDDAWPEVEEWRNYSQDLAQGERVEVLVEGTREYYDALALLARAKLME